MEDKELRGKYNRYIATVVRHIDETYQYMSLLDKRIAVSKMTFEEWCVIYDKPKTR